MKRSKNGINAKALAHLAQHPSQWFNSREVAEAIRADAHALSKRLSALAIAGRVKRRKLADGTARYASLQQRPLALERELTLAKALRTPTDSLVQRMDEMMVKLHPNSDDLLGEVVQLAQQFKRMPPSAQQAFKLLIELPKK